MITALRLLDSGTDYLTQSTPAIPLPSHKRSNAENDTMHTVLNVSIFLVSMCKKEGAFHTCTLLKTLTIEKQS